MKLRLLAFITLFTLLFSEGEIFAQAEGTDLVSPIRRGGGRGKIYVGVIGGYNYSLHTAELATFADVLCPSFENGDNHGFFGGVFWELPFGNIVNSKHAVIFRVLYNTLPASFEQGGDSYPSLVDDPSQPTGYDIINTTTKHTLEVNYSMLTIEPLYRFTVADQIGLCIGPTFDFPMTKTKEQKFLLIDPDYVQFRRPETPNPDHTYTDNDRTIIVHDGDIDGAAGFRLGLKLGIQYEILLGTGIDIIPEVFYNLGLTKVTDQEDWRVNAIQAGISVRFAI